MHIRMGFLSTCEEAQESAACLSKLCPLCRQVTLGKAQVPNLSSVFCKPCA